MPIHVKCGCGGIMWASDSHAGKTGRCPSCGATIRVPIPTAIPTAIPDILSAEAEPSISATASMPWYWRFVRGAAWVPLGVGAIYLVWGIISAARELRAGLPEYALMFVGINVGVFLIGSLLTGVLLVATDAAKHLKELRDKAAAQPGSSS